MVFFYQSWPSTFHLAGVSKGFQPGAGSNFFKIPFSVPFKTASGVLNGGVDFLTLDFFNGVLRHKSFPLDSVLKKNLAFLLLGGDCFMSGVIGDCLMSGVFGVAGLVIPI